MNLDKIPSYNKQSTDKYIQSLQAKYDKMTKYKNESQNLIKSTFG